MLPLLCAGMSACVPLAFMDQDVQYEKLQDDIYFLKVSAPPDSPEEALKLEWERQASLLCAGDYLDDAKIFHRTDSPSRNRAVDYKQMRGNIYCR